MTVEGRVKKAALFGIPCWIGADTKEHLQAVLKQLVVSKSYSVALNAEKFMAASSDDDLFDVICRAYLPYADGIGATIPMRAWGWKNCKKVNLPREIVDLCAGGGYRLAICGGRQGVASKAAEKLIEEFSDLEVVATCSGYLPDQELIDFALKVNADVLLLGLGSPRQELLAARIASASRICTIPCGGALDVFSGDKIRAPRLIQAAGLEWLYRLVQDPARSDRHIRLVLFLPKLIRALARANLARIWGGSNAIID